MAIYLRVNRLPSAYQEVEYIQSDGNQYINTGVKANSNISTEIVMQPNMSYVSEYAIFGDAWAANALFLMEYSGKYRLHNGGNYGDFATITDTKTTITTNNTGITINGTSYTLNAGSSYSNNNIWLFYTGDDTSGNRTKRGRFKLFSFKIWSSGTLTRDLVPCYRKSDSVIGLYDIENDVFYTNDGTGTFTKGSDVYPEKEVKNMYIGEYGWQPGANTIAYYPLTSDINDYSGNNRNLTQGTGTVTYNSSTNMAEINAKLTYSQALLPTNSDFTFGFWCYPNSWNNIGDENSGGPLWYMCNMPGEHKGNFKIGSSWKRLGGTTEISGPCHLMVTRSGSTFTLYVNGQSDSTLTNSGTIESSNVFYIASRPDGIGAVIIEDIAWDAQKVLDYYNLTKSSYGL